MKKRNPVYALQLSLGNAKDFFEKLQGLTDEIGAMEKDLKSTLKDGRDVWKETVLLRKAVWIALIIEIGRLFDTYDRVTQKVISFKKTIKNPSLKKIVDQIHGESIIRKIIKSRNTFTAHIAEGQEDFISAPEICESNLGELLNRLDVPLSMFTEEFTSKREWESLE
jgi:hypothetical protein